MRIRFPLIACGLVLSLPVLAGVGEWTSNGPFGGEVTRVAINPEDSQHMIAFSLLGVSRTIDGGASWSSINDSRLLMTDVEFDPDNDQIYVINNTGQVLRSGDLGETWSGGFTLPQTVGGFRALSIANVPGSTDVYLAVAPFEAEAALTTVLLFRSTDLGVTFTPIASGAGIPAAAAVRDVLALDTGGTTLLAGMGARDLGAALPQPPSIYRSTDSGATWAAVLTLAGTTSFTAETQLVRGAGGRLLATVGGQLYRSDDSGVTWTGMGATAGSSINIPNNIAADPVNPARFYSRGGAVALSLGGSAVSAGLSACDITGTQFLCTAIARLSPNLSYTMAQGTESLPGDVNSIQVDPTGAVWVGTDGLGVSRVSFVGGSWVTEQFNLGLSSVNVRAILIHPNPSTIGGGQHRRLYVGYGDIVTETAGVYLTTNGGTNWSPSNTGFRLTGVRDLTIDPTTAGIGQPAGTVPISASTLFASGRWPNWTISGAGLPRPYQGSSVLRSTDGGSTWQTIGGGMPFDTYTILGTPYSLPNIGTSRSVVLDPRSCASPPPGAPCLTGPLTRGFAGGDGRRNLTIVPDPVFPNKRLYDGRLLRSNNLSAATPAASVLWSDVSGVASGFPQSFDSDNAALRVTPVPIVVDPTDGNIVYVGTFSSFFVDPPAVVDPQSGVFKSTDGGSTWTQSSNGLPAYSGHTNRKLDVLALVINPNNPQVLWASVLDLSLEGSGSAPFPLYKTTDGGANWAPSATGIPARFDIRALTIDPGDPNVLYAAGYNQDTVTNPGGIYRSDDGGGTWRSISIGLPASSATAIEVDPVNPSTVHVGTRRGLWSLTQVPDADGDGAPDATENGIQGGDGNNDGQQDSVQGDVGSTGVALRSPDGLGGSNFTIDIVSSVSASNPANPCVQNVDVTGLLALQFGRDYLPNSTQYYNYPNDIVQFEILDCESAVVNVTYHSENFNEFGWTFRYFGPGTPGDSSNVKWWDFSTRAVKLNDKTWQITLDNDELGSYRPPASNLIRFIGGPACFDTRGPLFVHGFENTNPLTPPACN